MCTCMCAHMDVFTYLAKESEKNLSLSEKFYWSLYFQDLGAAVSYSVL